MQSDPIGLDGGENSYLYANGNSLRFVDTNGFFSLDDVKDAIKKTVKYVKDKAVKADKYAVYQALIKIGPRINSSFEKKMVHRWIYNEGDYHLSDDEFYDIVTSGRISQYLYNGRTTINLYGNSTYDFAIGRGTVIFENGLIAGFYDRFDFDPKKWGERTKKAELATRIGFGIGIISMATPFNIIYGL